MPEVIRGQVNEAVVQPLFLVENIVGHMLVSEITCKLFHAKLLDDQMII